MKKIQLKQVLQISASYYSTIILPIGWYIFFDQPKRISPSIYWAMLHLFHWQ